MGLKDNQTALLCNGIADREPPQHENLQLLRCCRKPLCDKSSSNCIHWHPGGSNAEHSLSVSTWESQSHVKEHKRGPPHSSALIPYPTWKKNVLPESSSQPSLPILALTDVKQQRLHVHAASFVQLM